MYVFFIYVVNNEAAIIIATILLFVLSLLLIVLSILYVFHIVACVKYFGGKEYVVPLSIRFFK